MFYYIEISALDSFIFISFICSLFYWNKIYKEETIRLFPLFTLFSFITDFITASPADVIVKRLILIIFMCFEFFVMNNFYLKITTDKKMRYLVLILSIPFTAAAALSIFSALVPKGQSYSLPFSSVISIFMVIECILIVVPAIFYYRLLFEHNPGKNLFKDPAFLITTGILFCFTLPIPVYTFGYTIAKTQKEVFSYLYLINSIGYIILHSFIIKTYTILK